MLAARHEHHDDVVADRQICDVLAERFDDARRFVPLSHGHWPGTIAIDHRQIGMAQPSRANADQHFVAARTVRVQGLDPQRLADSVWCFGAHSVQDRSSDFYCIRPFGGFYAVSAMDDCGLRATVRPYVSSDMPPRITRPPRTINPDMYDPV
jgi:hypothetical protein